MFGHVAGLRVAVYTAGTESSRVAGPIQCVVLVVVRHRQVALGHQRQRILEHCQCYALIYSSSTYCEFTPVLKYGYPLPLVKQTL